MYQKKTTFDGVGSIVIDCLFVYFRPQYFLIQIPV